VYERPKGMWLSLAAWFTILLALLLFAQSILNLDYDWNFSFLLDYLWVKSEENEFGRPGILLQGLWGTVWVSALSLIFGLLIGLGVGVLLTINNKSIQFFAQTYVEFVRNTPLLVLLYVVFFAIGTLFDFSPEQAGVLGLSLFCGAYTADVVRGGIVHFKQKESGQIDAGLMLGMNSIQVVRYIAAPQIARQLAPAILSQCVSLVKDSSLVSVISLVELTKAAANVVSTSFRNFETWIVVALAYFLLNFSISYFFKRVEKKWKLN
jgi:polar amino acid transport system permease protein